MGLLRTGRAALSAEIGKGRTPRNGAGPIGTESVALELPGFGVPWSPGFTQEGRSRSA